MLIFDHPNILYTKECFNTDDLNDILDNDTYEFNDHKNNVQQINKQKLSTNQIPSKLPKLPILYDVHQYDANQYDANQYDVNQYNANRYDANRYDGYDYL
jgi:hypothetical protein